MFKRIDHIEIIPRDFDASIKFYTEVFGFKVKAQMPVASPPLEEIAYLQLGDTVVEMMRVADAKALTHEPWGTGYRLMALEVEDMDKAIDYLAGKGVPVTWGPVTLGPSKRAEVQDIDGLPIELRQW
jgi:glyoxylase I family protein